VELPRQPSAEDAGRPSAEEPKSLEAIGSEREHGDPARELSALERAALEASMVALELEVWLAGFGSVTESKRSCAET